MSVNFTRSAFPRIVTAADAAEPVRFAADELRRYLAQVLGAAPAAVDQPQGPVIRLRETPGTDLGEEGYLIAAEDGELRISGGSPRAVLYGAYEFLRRFAGCLFSGLAPDGEYIPAKNAVIFDSAPVRMIPGFWCRSLQLYWNDGLDLMKARLDWMAKNGMNMVMYHARPDDLKSEADTFDPETGARRGGDVRFFDSEFRRYVLPHLRKRGLLPCMGGHNLLNFLPPEKYFQAHPEWYALRGGKRLGDATQICVCTSNPAMLAELTRNCLEFLRAHPEVKSLELAPQDGVGGCECDACRAQDASPDDVFRKYGNYRTPAGENPSKVRRYVRLVNHVARAVRQEFPDVIIGYVAYADLFHPPQDIKLEENVNPIVVLYWQCGAHPVSPCGCAVNRFFYRNLRRWREVHNGRVTMVNYLMGMHAQKCLPYPIAALVGRDAQMFKELGIDGGYTLFRDSCFKAYNLNYLAFARWGWWNSVDPGRLLDEYLLGVFGAPGRALRPIWESFQKSMRRIEQESTDASTCLQFIHADPSHPGGCLLPNGFNVAFFMDELGERTLARCLAQARKLAVQPREQRQLRDFAEAAAYWKAAAGFYRNFHPTSNPAPDQSLAALLACYRRAHADARKIVRLIRAAKGQGWFYLRLDQVWLEQVKQIERAIEKLRAGKPGQTGRASGGKIGAGN